MKNDEISLKALHERLIAVEAFDRHQWMRVVLESSDPYAEIDAVIARAREGVDRFSINLPDAALEALDRMAETVRRII